MTSRIHGPVEDARTTTQIGDEVMTEDDLDKLRALLLRGLERAEPLREEQSRKKTPPCPRR